QRRWQRRSRFSAPEESHRTQASELRCHLDRDDSRGTLANGGHMNTVTLPTARAFHGHLESETFFRPKRVVETTEQKYFVIQDRSLSYRFYLHQHPYVRTLIQRLLQRGTKGLQAADTEYNTRAQMTNATPARDASGAPVQIAAGEVVYLADGAAATVDG